MREAAMQNLTQEADLITLRGWLALESGNVELARQELGAAFELGHVRSDTYAAGLAVGTTPLPGQDHFLYLHSLPLAETGRRWIENAAR